MIITKEKPIGNVHRGNTEKTNPKKAEEKTILANEKKTLI